MQVRGGRAASVRVSKAGKKNGVGKCELVCGPLIIEFRPFEVSKYYPIGAKQHLHQPFGQLFVLSSSSERILIWCSCGTKAEIFRAITGD